VVGLPWAADSCPWVGKLRTVLPLTDGIRDSAVQLVLTHQVRCGVGNNSLQFRPWTCSLCAASTYSRDSLLTHATGRKHREALERVRAARAADPAAWLK
jgi:hypothetical protein